MAARTTPEMPFLAVSGITRMKLARTGSYLSAVHRSKVREGAERPLQHTAMDGPEPRHQLDKLRSELTARIRADPGDVATGMIGFSAKPNLPGSSPLTKTTGILAVAAFGHQCGRRSRAEDHNHRVGHLFRGRPDRRSYLTFRPPVSNNQQPHSGHQQSQPRSDPGGRLPSGDRSAPVATRVGIQLLD